MLEQHAQNVADAAELAAVADDVVQDLFFQVRFGAAASLMFTKATWPALKHQFQGLMF